MALVRMEILLECDIEKVWEIVTSRTDYAWRSDLSKIENVDESSFIEYTKEGYETCFKVTSTMPEEKWEFDMENGNMKGHWCGLFTAKGDKTQLTLIEEVEAK